MTRQTPAELIRAPGVCITSGCGKPAEGLKCVTCLADGDRRLNGGQDFARNNGAGISDIKKHQPQQLKKSEADVRLEIKRWYRLQGAKVWDTEQERAGARVDAGLPDLIVIWPGVGVRFIECKSEDGKQRIEQLEFQRACEVAGGIYLLARDVEECMQFEGRGGG